MSTHSAVVSFIRCPDYTADIGSALIRTLMPLGGLESFVRPGQRVLVKPNLLTSRPPQEAVTTHPEIVRALLRLIRRIGADPLVADSPANAVRIDAVWDKTGFRQMCNEESVPLVNLEKAGSRSFTINGMEFSIAQPVLDADVIINMPKVKTHVLTIFTGAVKNLYGTVPGFQKTSLHKRYPTPREFGRLMAAIYSQVIPTLTIADGIVGHHGDGPSAGKPIPLGFIAAAADGVALDLAICRKLHIKIRSVPYFRPLREAGIGPADPEHITMVGEGPDPRLVSEFRIPRTIVGRLIPGRLVKALKHFIWIRPTITSRCIRCGRCVKACPAGALSMTDHDPPVLTPRLCIECCCCHEVCPEKAIEMNPSPLLKLARRGHRP